ncbi:MAG: GH116 family glycosyl hydrolase [Paludibacter sp.]|nr:GH116 family glycosyl hydrolase [Paludibacter sp.]
MNQQYSILLRLAKTMILFCLMVCAQSAHAQDKKWSANWIWTSDQGPNNTWVDFRKKVILNSKPTVAITRIAAENKYWLYINDVLVVNDGGLETRPNLHDTYYDEIDIAPYLKKGENIICALVWHKGGHEGYTQRALPDGGFLFESQLMGSNIPSVISDNTWKVKVDSAFVRGIYLYKYGVSGAIKFDNTTFGGEPIAEVTKFGYYRPAGSSAPFIRCANENESFSLPGKCDVAYGTMDNQLKIMADYKWIAYPVSYDARNEKQGWHKYNYSESSWKNAITKGIPPVAPWNKLVHRTIPFWKNYGLTTYINQAELPKSISENTTISGNLGINIQGTPYLKLNAPAGVHVRIVLNDFYYQEYITKNGEQEFECYAWQNSSSHTVKYQFTNVTGPVQILDLKFRQTSYNTEIIGSFNSNDNELNTLWTKCKNTSFVCMRDYFYDCPNRERGQWWGDVSEQILYSFYLYDQSSAKLAQKAFRELLNTQKADGSLYTTAPGKAFNLPDQNMAAVSMLWNYYMYTVDKALLEELYPFAKKFIQQCASTANNDGILIMQPTQGWDLWNWIDWGSNMDIQAGSANTVCNGLYVVLLNNVINMAKTLGANADIPYYQALQAKVKSKFNDYFWNGKAYAFNNKNGVMSATVDDRSGAWAVLAGMVDDAKKQLVLNTLKTRNDASPYQEMYIELAMSQLDPIATLHRTRTRFSAMINSWSSTLWEEFPANNSNNHAWSVGPMYYLSAYFLGIRPLKPAFTEFAFLPLMGDLKQISGNVPSPQGTITASCSIDSTISTLTQKITSPANTICIVGIPKQAFGKGVTFKEIKAGSDIIWQNGSAKGNVAGIEFYEEDAQFIKFRVQAGNWEFKSVANDPANVGITSIISPISQVRLNKTEPVKIRVFNENKTEQVNVPVSYTINNESAVTELIPSIPALSSIDYTFTKTANLSALKNYQIAVRTQAAVDLYSADDTLSTSITNYAKGLDWAMMFTGTGSGKIEIPDAPDLMLNHSFTLSAWVYPMGFRTNYWENTIVSTETNASGYALDLGGNGQGRIVVYSDGWKEAVAPVGSIVLNKWQHITGTYDGSTIKFYVDGILKATTQVGALATSTGPLYIGETSAWGGREFNGGIDEVQIWNKVLSDKEVQDMKTKKQTGKESGLVAYYNFNEGINSTIIKDQTSNNHNGSFLNLDTHTSWMYGMNVPQNNK